MVEMLTTLAIHKCRVVRAWTDRPEISYNVKRSNSYFEARKLLVSTVKARLEGASQNFRGIVYCRGRKTTEEMANLIGCNPFHSDRPAEERKTSFNDWVAGKDKFIVSTSLLGCGIDVEGVEVVYHFLTPWSVMDYVQESGRAGRGGKWAESCIFVCNGERVPDIPKDSFGYEIMRKWVSQTSTCRRVALSSFLDGRAVTCTLLPNANICDVCKRKEDEPHPRRPAEIAVAVTSPACVPKIGPLPPIPPPSLDYARERLEAPPAAR